MSPISRLLAAGVVAAGLLGAVLSGCVTSPSSSGGGATGGGRGSNNPVVAKLDGRDIRADEVFKSPIFRQAVRQWATVEHIKQKATASGVKVDQADVQARIDEQKAQIEMSGMNFDDMLRMQGMTLEDMTAMFEFQALIEEYAKQQAAAVSDEEIHQAWIDRESIWRDRYTSMHYLPESRKAELTFDEIKDWIKDQLIEEQTNIVQQTMFTNALIDVKLEIPSLGGPSEHEKWISIIIGAATPSDNGDVEEIIIDEAELGAAAGETPSSEDGSDAETGASEESGGQNEGAETGDAGSTSDDAGK